MDVVWNTTWHWKKNLLSATVNTVIGLEETHPETGKKKKKRNAQKTLLCFKTWRLKKTAKDERFSFVDSCHGETESRTSHLLSTPNVLIVPITPKRNNERRVMSLIPPPNLNHIFFNQLSGLNPPINSWEEQDCAWPWPAMYPSPLFIYAPISRWLANKSLLKL